MTYLEIKGLNKRFGNFIALNDISLSIAQGEFLVLLGPSGCGKTTLLRTIAGLEHQDSGTIVQQERDISCLPPAARDYGIVFQSYALFPNLNVGQNVAYGLNARREGREAFRHRVDEMLALVGLPGTENKYPSQLSGGQQQRIALARALATRPGLLLLDEPLSALDAIERVRLRTEMRRLQQSLGVTTLMVTHDQEEALAMADRIVIMRNGLIEQIGHPQAIYNQPASAFVADFIGRSNRLVGQSLGNGLVDLFGLILQTHRDIPSSQECQFHIRPEDIVLSHALDAVENSVLGTVEHREFLGPNSLLSVRTHVRGMPQLVVQLASKTLQEHDVRAGSTVRVVIPAASLYPLPSN